MRKEITILLFVLLAALLSEGREMLLNDIQVKGSHFSFHQAPQPSIAYFNYSHADLESQLEKQDVHAVELKFGFESQNQDFPVYATRGIDGVSSCPNVSFCLQAVRRYTVAHPNHFPLFVVLEAAATSQMPTSKWVWDWFDGALTAVWPQYEIVKPRDVMGSFASVKKSVRARGWPTLRSCMGKVVFLLRVNATAYADTPNGLQDRVGFPIRELGDDSAADAVVFETAHPLYRTKDIQAAVRSNYLVLTRTDATFTPAGVDAFDAAAYFALLDADGDGRATTAELEALFGAGMQDLTDGATSSPAAIVRALGTAVFECAGAGADAVTRAQFECVLADLRAVLPAPESLVTVQARTASAKKSGAHILLTHHPAPPFKGAPAGTYWWLDFGRGCNPVTACECYLADYIAIDRCSAAARVHGAVPCLTVFLLLIFLVFILV